LSDYHRTPFVPKSPVGKPPGVSVVEEIIDMKRKRVKDMLLRLKTKKRQEEMRRV